MAARIRFLAQDARAAHQFVAMCDCNVTEEPGHHRRPASRGGSPEPLRLETNYTGRKGGSGIDYVMAERASDFRIDSYESYHRLVTDHPGIVATFTRGR